MSLQILITNITGWPNREVLTGSFVLASYDNHTQKVLLNPTRVWHQTKGTRALVFWTDARLSKKYEENVPHINGWKKNQTYTNTWGPITAVYNVKWLLFLFTAIKLHYHRHLKGPKSHVTSHGPSHIILPNIHHVMKATVFIKTFWHESRIWACMPWAFCGPTLWVTPLNQLILFWEIDIQNTFRIIFISF